MRTTNFAWTLGFCALLFGCSSSADAEDENEDESSALATLPSSNVKVLDEGGQQNEWFHSNGSFYVTNDGSWLRAVNGSVRVEGVRSTVQNAAVAPHHAVFTARSDSGMGVYSSDLVGPVKHVGDMRVFSRLAADESGAYFVGSSPSDQNVDLIRIDRTGALTVIARNVITKPDCTLTLLLDAQHVFGAGCGEIIRVRKTGGSVEVIGGAAVLGPVTQTDREIVFAASARQNDPSRRPEGPFRLMSIPKTATAPVSTVILEMPSQVVPQALAVRGSEVWIGYEDSRDAAKPLLSRVAKAPLSQGARATLVAELRSPIRKLVASTLEGVALSLVDPDVDDYQAVRSRLVMVSDPPVGGNAW